MTEAELLAAVLEIARFYGWKTCHFRPAQTAKGWRTPIQGDAGYPDLTMVRKGRLIFAELKSDKGRLTQEQQNWLGALTLCCGIQGAFVSPVEVYTWRPADLPEIAKLLR